MVVTHFGLVDVVEQQLYIIPRVMMASDDVGLSRVSFIKIPNTNAILIIRKRTNYLFLRYLPAFQGRTITKAPIKKYLVGFFFVYFLDSSGVLGWVGFIDVPTILFYVPISYLVYQYSSMDFFYTLYKRQEGLHDFSADENSK